MLAPRRRSALGRFVTSALALSLFSALAVGDPMPSITIPPQNRVEQRRAPPRPPVGDAAARAQHVVEALRSGTDDVALDFFLPREPFLAIKDMNGAARYFDTLVRQYRRDLATYRAQLPRGSSPLRFVRFELSSSCTWMTAGREANRLPYWSCYGSNLVAEQDGREHRFRVQVLINWGDQWYVTHLGPIPRSH